MVLTRNGSGAQHVPQDIYGYVDYMDGHIYLPNGLANALGEGHSSQQRFKRPSLSEW